MEYFELSRLEEYLDRNVSEHFTYREFFYSATAVEKKIKNFPATEEEWIEVWRNLNILCDTILEPIRSIFGAPLKITSGYRCPRLNAIVSFAKIKSRSAHLDGSGGDFVVVGVDRERAMTAIVRSPVMKQIDQIILEGIPPNRIHVAHRQPVEPRHQALVTAEGGKYEAWQV